MRIVIALGGNALLRRGEKPDAATQIANVEAAIKQLAPLAEEHEVVITHGNGPQVGVLALQSANDTNLSAPYAFDTLGAQTQGMIGYWLLQSLQNNLPGRQVAALVNQTLVLAGDPAFDNPTKFVGQVYNQEEARRLEVERGWKMKADGDYFRRVVGSPWPQRVVETRLIRRMLEVGAVVVCAGGGGIPVIRNDKGKLEGIEAVVDKDLTAAVLAEHLEADFLMILTDVPAVMENFGKPDQKEIHRSSPHAMRQGGFPAGSMGPKVEAACRFVELTGDVAAIGQLADAQKIIEGEAGTIITPGGNYGGSDDITPHSYKSMHMTEVGYVAA
ncbi:MAG: carbamate kinase [Mobiluncus porci]|uniref:Carbamate kinase n=1 Tax=Mobiluncus porci TaxID=2652278 RepID=A0A7K0K1F8_9ACTO|nr:MULTISPECIES: carbamate kinase [Mobiluncus]MCI6585398.1 carbamate kinase [Mobiluncus sp.]MDD7541393.1 carbamate kinase [Mobiluncus porci]MDY5748378.1 carbamate kinase [Mobiluncus porci]MST48865.1 carbamate kinase [Mobiluncus porci]